MAKLNLQRWRIPMNLKSLIPVGRSRMVVGSEPFGSLQREINRLFEDFASGFPSFGGATRDVMPTMDVAETDKQIEITVELPGLEEQDVQLNLSDNTLTIRGEKRAEREQKEKDYHLVERSYGSFSRTLELPARVNADDIKASISKGVLSVTVPKPAPAQVKKIQIKAAA
jgi:HSP20 family protein